MLKANKEKTEWVPKKKISYFIVGFLFLLLLMGGFWYWLGVRVPTDQMHINGHAYTLLVASTPTTQMKGLGDRPSLKINDGMVFPFNSAATRCFWMKDMHFPIDIIWLGVHKSVVYIEANVSPDTYPEVFCPTQPAQYVIELNAGQAKVAGINIGQTVYF